LIPLFSRSFPDLDFRSKESVVSESEYDCYLQIGSLYKALEDINVKTNDMSRSPYIFADEGRAQELRASLYRGKRLCGVTWRSQKAPYSDAKSMTLYDLLPLLKRTDMDFVSLQYGDVSAEIHEFYEKTGIRILECESIDNFNDLDGHAALIKACDLTILSSNTTAHIVGALGVPAFLMAPWARGMFFYWALIRSGRSFWYPQMQIFNQGEDLDWGRPIVAACEAIV